MQLYKTNIYEEDNIFQIRNIINAVQTNKKGKRQSKKKLQNSFMMSEIQVNSANYFETCTFHIYIQNMSL